MKYTRNRYHHSHSPHTLSNCNSLLYLMYCSFIYYVAARSRWHPWTSGTTQLWSYYDLFSTNFPLQVFIDSGRTNKSVTTNERIGECVHSSIQIERFHSSFFPFYFHLLRQWLNGTVRQVDSERCYYDTLIIILTTLERCMANQTKDTARFEEAMNVKLLLRELCQFIDINESNPNALALKALASKVLFALSQNHFGAVFNRISARLQELSATSEENPDFSDIELIQHIDLDVPRLTKLLTGVCHCSLAGSSWD